MKKNLSLFLLVSLLFSALLLFSCNGDPNADAPDDPARDLQNEEKNPEEEKEQTTPDDANQYAGVVILNNLTGEEFVNERIDKTDEIVTALDAVLFSCDRHSVKIVHDGSFVSEVNGLKNNEEDSTFWVYTVSGKTPGYGLSDLILENNDVVVISYERVGG